MPKEEKRKKHKKEKKHKHKRSPSPSSSSSSSSSSDDEEQRLEALFKEETRKEREAERQAERLDSDGEGDSEGERLERELEEEGEVTEIVRRDGRREKVLKMQDGEGAFVVEDGHLSEGEDEDLDRDIYAPAARERIDRRRRRREEDPDVQRVLERNRQRDRQREIEELRKDRRIAESSSFGEAARRRPETTGQPEAAADGDLDAFRSRLRVRAERTGPRTERERFLLWAEIPVIKMFRADGYERIRNSKDGELERYVKAQATFGKQTSQRLQRARTALRQWCRDNELDPFGEAFRRILLPSNGEMLAPFRCDELKCLGSGSLRCSFTDRPIADGSVYYNLLIDGARYICPSYSLVARLDGLSKFTAIEKHIASTAKRRLAELSLPVDGGDWATSMLELFADEQWLSEICSVYEFGIKFCDEVASRFTATADSAPARPRS